MKRPVLLCDLDNVVYDWVGAMASWLYRNHVTDESVGLMARYTQWAVWEDWGIPKGEFIRWWRLGVEAGEIYRLGPIIPGARKALWQLSDAEWDIHIATSRLTKFGLHDQIVINTAEWLRDNNIPYRNIHFTDWKQGIAAEAIVDDRADNMSEVAHMNTFVFPANHNTDHNVTAQEQIQAWEGIVSTLVSEETMAGIR